MTLGNRCWFDAVSCYEEESNRIMFAEELLFIDDNYTQQNNNSLLRTYGQNLCVFDEYDVIIVNVYMLED